MSMAVIEADGGDRRRLLQVVRELLARGDLIDRPATIAALAGQSHVAEETIIERWATVHSVVTDLISEDQIAVGVYPESDEPFAGMTSEQVLQALFDNLSQTVTSAAEDPIARHALGLVIPDARGRQVWQELITGSMDRWAELVQVAAARSSTAEVPGLAAAAQSAVRLVFTHCYSSLLLGQHGALDSRAAVVEIANSLVVAPITGS